MICHEPRAGCRIAALIIALCFGCASLPETVAGPKRTAVETTIQLHGLHDDPAIEAQRAVIDAAAAREDETPIFDGIELRAAAVHEVEDKMQMLARVSIGNLWTAGATREVWEAETDVEVARLSEVTFEQRVRLCLPSLEHLVYEERSRIYEGYADRHRALLEWNEDMETAGLLNEVSAMRFALAGRVRLSSREPLAPAADALREGNARVLAVLPAPGVGPGELTTEPETIQNQLVVHHPSIGVYRAEERRYAALERRERLGRYPSLRFVDVGYEPIAFPGDERQLEARVAFEIPFGRAPAAGARRYEALARGERSAEQAVLRDRALETRAALEEINRFRRRGDYWLELLDHATAAEQVADRWWNERLADPSAILGLLDEVYDARMTVLDAQVVAGEAGCAVMASTGTTVEEWPH